MRRARILGVLFAVLAALLVLAPAALAKSYGGEGWYGETSDQTITYAMYLVIGFFPVVIIILSLVQWRLERRRHARMASAKRRKVSADWHGGW
jgi:membrane protease YdiL (CAAX protease family)